MGEGAATVKGAKEREVGRRDQESKGGERRSGVGRRGSREGENGGRRGQESKGRKGKRGGGERRANWKERETEKLWQKGQGKGRRMDHGTGAIDGPGEKWKIEAKVFLSFFGRPKRPLISFFCFLGFFVLLIFLLYSVNKCSSPRGFVKFTHLKISEMWKRLAIYQPYLSCSLL